MGGASARVTIELLNVDTVMIDGTSSSVLRVAFARNISAALGVDAQAVKDLFGQTSSTSLTAAQVGGRRGLKITAYVTVPEGSSANALASLLYTEQLRQTLVETVRALLHPPVVLGSVGVQTVSITPETFKPLLPTTTATTTTMPPSTSTITRTSTLTSTVTTTKRHLDMSTSADQTTTDATTDETTTTEELGEKSLAATQRGLTLVMWALSAVMIQIIGSRT